MRRSSTSALPEPVFFTDRDLGLSVPFAARVYQERDDVNLWVTHRQWMEGRQIGRW
jgi:hypothetical protein